MPFDPSTAQPVDNVPAGTSHTFDPNSAQEAPSYSALSDSTYENVAAGMGKFVHDRLLGGKQIVANAADAVTAGASRFAAQFGGHVTPTDYSSGVNQEIKDSRELDKELDASIAGKAGEILGGAMVMAAMPVAGGSGLAAYAGTAATGAAIGATDPTLGDESRIANTALGAAGGAVGMGVGQVAGKVIGRVIQPFRNVGSPEMDNAVLNAAANGIPLTAGQQLGYGSKTISLDQRQAFTRAVLAKIGLNSDTADATTMMTVRGTTGNTFDAIAARNPVVYDSTLSQHLMGLEVAASKELEPAQMKVLQNQIDFVRDNAYNNGGALPGEAFSNVRAVLARLSGSQDHVRNFWMDKLDDVLLEALGRSAKPGDQALLGQTKQTWRALKQIEPAIDSENYISPSKLYSAIDKTKNVNQTVYGQGPQQLAQLAQAGKNVFSAQGPTPYWNAARIMSYSQAAAGLGAAEELARGNPRGAGALALYAGGAQAIKAASQNPAVGAALGSWARSTVLKDWRQSVSRNLMEMGANIGGSVGAQQPLGINSDDVSGMSGSNP